MEGRTLLDIRDSEKKINTSWMNKIKSNGNTGVPPEPGPSRHVVQASK